MIGNDRHVVKWNVCVCLPGLERERNERGREGIEILVSDLWHRVMGELCVCEF